VLVVIVVTDVLEVVDELIEVVEDDELNEVVVMVEATVDELDDFELLIAECHLLDDDEEELVVLPLVYEWGVADDEIDDIGTQLGQVLLLVEADDEGLDVLLVVELELDELQ
jgi:hypothetical protein